MPVTKAITPVAFFAALGISAPVSAQTTEDPNYAQMHNLTIAAPVAPAAPAYAPQAFGNTPAYANPQAYANPGPYIDCNNPYYATYCQAYAAWYQQYYRASQYYGNGDYDYYPYAYHDYGFGVPVGFGFFHRHGEFFNHGFPRSGFGFRGGFHGGAFRGGGFHGGGGGHGGGGHR